MGERDKAAGGDERRTRLARKRLDAELAWLRAELDLVYQGAVREPGGEGQGGEGQGGEAPDERVAQIRANRDARVAELAGRGSLAFDELLARFGLDELDRALLAIAIANEVAPDFARRFALLHGHGERTWPTAALVMETGLVPERRWPALRARLAPDAPLLHYRLVSLGGDPDYLGPLHQPLIASARALAHVAGDTRLDPRLRAHATHWPVDHTFATPLQLEAPLARTLARARSALRVAPGEPPPLFVIAGPLGAGRARLAHTLAGELGQGVLRLDLGALGRDHGYDLEAGVRYALREARLVHAVPCFAGWDALLAEPRQATEEDAPQAAERHRLEDVARTLARALDGFDGPVALLVEDAHGEAPAARTLGREVVRLEVAMPTAEAAAALWRGALGGGAGADDALADRLGRTFVLTPGQIEDAGRAVLREEALAPAGPLDFQRVHEEVKRQLRNRLGDIATLVTKRYAWDELVADVTVKVQLRELISRHRHHHTVMQSWRFAERFGRATGISALFEGPPGTGKTMAASIVAGELGLDLFQVDLAQVVSKYIGETEKQLARLFDEAERAGAVLLFDEADSLFSKRTQVSSSNDRYSNLKVNFLLQRIERFTGVAVLTTNFPESMDEAFSRRVTVRVRFPQPDAKARARLWETMLSRCEVLGDDVDYDELADEFELSGGLIRNSVLRAAYMAASRRGVIDYELLALAARIELKQQGKLLVGDPMSDLAATYAAEERS